MRIAFVLPSLEAHGAQRVIVTLLKYHDRSRYQPELVVLDGSGPLAAEVPREIQVHDLGSKRLRYGAVGLWRTLRNIGAPVIISTIGYVNVAVLMMRPWLRSSTRILVREANMPSGSLPASPWPRLFQVAYRGLYPHASAVICSSRRMHSELHDKLGVPAERLVVIPNPVDVYGVRLMATPARRVPGEGIRLVAAGRLTPQKGFDRLIEWFAKLPDDAHLTMLGQGDSAEMLALKAVELGVGERVEFTGFCPVPWPWLAGADAFLLPSRWEGMSNAALEALACGTPVIAMAEAGGIVEVAEAAVHGALTLANDSVGFIDGMRNVVMRTGIELRPSLLPTAFQPACVWQALEQVLVAPRGVDAK